MFQIAIDGPSASGKTTISQSVAKKLNFVFLSTGMVYRAIAYLHYHENLPFAALLTQIPKRIKLQDNCVLIDHMNYGDLLQSEQVSKWTSAIATNQLIRQIAVKMQQAFAVNQNIIMDGRDVCSVVLPHANLKIFIDANVKIRAQRRLVQLNLPNQKLPEIINDLTQRDQQDATREIAPLKRDENAHILDTSNLTIEQCVTIIENWYVSLLGKNKCLQ